MDKQKVDDHCIRHEGKYRDVGVYVVVVLNGGCPVEMVASLAFPPSQAGMDRCNIYGKFKDLEDISNAWLSCGGPISGLISFLNRPPCEMSGILGDALIAAMEA